MPIASGLHSPPRPCAFVALAACMVLPGLNAQDPPRVIERSPAHLAADVDAARVVQLVVTFDRDMNTGGYSLCGGGPAFPSVKGTPTWKDARTLCVDVALEPDHEYQLGLNSQTATAFRSKDGVQLAPVAWAFSTLPKDLPDQTAQQQRNTKALDVLIETIAERYSHQDLRVRDWPALWNAHREALVTAPTDRVFASRAAQALAATEDIHLYLRFGERVLGTGSRSIDSLFRRARLTQYVATQPVGTQALTGITDDGIGYLLIGAWSSTLDMPALDEALEELRDARALVIDVRPNSGGDELLAQRVAAWFVEGTKPYAKHRFRTRAGKDGFGPVMERKLKGNADGEKQYRGPIAVLTSRYVMSSNESFVLMMRQAPDCTVVGQRTFGSSGNPKPFELGNGVTIVVPTWQDLRLDGTYCEGEGIAPDVEVAVDVAELERRDPILERALELLRAKLAK